MMIRIVAVAIVLFGVVIISAEPAKAYPGDAGAATLFDR